MNLDIKGKVFFITGSTKGIGLGIAKTLLEEDCDVIINGRNQDLLNKIKNDLRNKYSGSILAVAGDVNEVAIVKKVKEKVLERWGHLDGVVANVGAVKTIHEWEIPEKDWNLYFTNNFSVAYNVIQAFVPLLTISKGSIITIGSIAGLEDVGAPMPYVASKAALMAYTKSLSRKLADKKIRVNMVSPGNILFPGGNWDKKQKLDPDIIRKMLQEKVPLKTFGSPEDIGNAVAFLLSSKASFITGANIVVDGGQTSSIN